jgi:hypothetical protein
MYLIERKYVIRDKQNRPRVDVVLLVETETAEWTRGISICSRKENPNRIEGFNKAAGRAVKALIQQKDCLPIQREEACLDYIELELPAPAFKAAYKPKLTEFEQKILAEFLHLLTGE